MPEIVQKVKGHSNFYPKILKGENEVDKEFKVINYNLIKHE